MRRIIMAVCIVLAPGLAAAQDSLSLRLDSLNWRTTLDLGLTLTQNTYSNNWAGGDAGSLTWVAGANVNVEKEFRSSFNWRNALRLAYGQTHTQDATSNEWRRPFKSTDMIDFESLLRYLNWRYLPPYAAFRLISQFEDARDPNHKLHINPIDLSESVGLSREVYKRGDDEFLTRAGVALRQRIMRDFADSTFADTKTTTSTDGGIEWVTDGKYKIPHSQIACNTKLSVFKAFFYSRADELEGTESADYWKAVDVNWEDIFSAQVSKYIAVSLYVQWLYDKEIDRGGRFKETLALALTWKML